MSEEQPTHAQILRQAARKLSDSTIHDSLQFAYKLAQHSAKQNRSLANKADREGKSPEDNANAAAHFASVGKLVKLAQQMVLGSRNDILQVAELLDKENEKGRIILP